MMSWIRTATSLITFGFTIYKFFQIEAPPRTPVRLIGPRDFAAMLVSIGLVTLLLGMLEYRNNIRDLGGQHAAKQRSLSVITAALVFIVGVLGLLAVIFRQ
jgi:putative membrane protein